MARNFDSDVPVASDGEIRQSLISPKGKVMRRGP